jgi:hypothetical protein
MNYKIYQRHFEDAILIVGEKVIIEPPTKVIQDEYPAILVSFFGEKTILGYISKGNQFWANASEAHGANVNTAIVNLGGREQIESKLDELFKNRITCQNPVYIF